MNLNKSGKKREKMMSESQRKVNVPLEALVRALCNVNNMSGSIKKSSWMDIILRREIQPDVQAFVTQVKTELITAINTGLNRQTNLNPNLSSFLMNPKEIMEELEKTR